MIQQAYDRFSFFGDTSWWRMQGYPLVKGVALFHLDKLVPDEHWNDGTLITVPCNSPEQTPITLGKLSLVSCGAFLTSVQAAPISRLSYGSYSAR
jgi:hypothetical protein